MSVTLSGRTGSLLALAAVIAILPLFLPNNFYYDVAILIGLNAIVCVGLNLLIGFAGQRVIEETIREKLPEGFQRAEYLLDHGMVDMVVQRRELRETLARILSLLRHKVPAGTTALTLGDTEIDIPHGVPHSGHHAKPDKRAEGE